MKNVSSLENEETCHERAVRYWKMGLSVLPLPFGRKFPPQVPGGWERYQHQRATEEEINQWFTGKDLNIAIITGAISRIVVVDCDDDAAHVAAVEKFGPTDWQTRTSRGIQLFYRHPEEKVANRAKVSIDGEKLNLDMRGDGGYVVAPGSQHPDGTMYQEVNSWREFNPGSVPLFNMAILADSRQEPKGRSSENTITPNTLETRILDHIHNAQGAVEGDGGDTVTFKMACDLVRGFELAPEEAFPFFAIWNERCEPQWDDDDLRQKLANAFAYGDGDFGYLLDSNLANGFHVNDSGVFYREDGERIRICSKLEILAETRDEKGESWGRLLRITDRDGRVKKWAMPCSLLASDGTELLRQLLDFGLDIEPGRRIKNLLIQYIMSAKPGVKALCVSRIGWHGETFVLPDLTIGQDRQGEEVILQSNNKTHSAIKSQGNLGEWQEHVANLCAWNSRPVFSLSTAFAAPLLRLLNNEESGGFHLRGPTSIGKTTNLIVAGSVWGGGDINGFIETWRSTANGLESIAEGRCDSLLPLDEIGEVNGKDVGSVVYMLGNGSGKNRATKYGSGTVPKKQWAIIFLSTGEKSLADHMSEAALTTRAGQETRMVDVPADAGVSMGTFETFHQCKSPREFAEALKENSRKYYGSAIVEFLGKLTADIEGAKKSVMHFRAEFMANHCPQDASAQVQRIAKRFSLVAAAGELAIQFGVLPWTAGHAAEGVGFCFADSLASRGGAEDSDSLNAIDAIRSFLLTNDARFKKIEVTRRLSRTDLTVETLEERVINNQLGFKKENGEDTDYFIFPAAFKKEACRGMDSKTVAKILSEKGVLVTDSEGRNSVSRKFPGIRQTRVYHVTSKIFSI